MNVKLTLSGEEDGDVENAAHKRHSRNDSWEIKMDDVMACLITSKYFSRAV